MFIKDGVDINGIKPEILLAVFISSQVYAYYSLSVTITSCTDGNHGHGSLHYAGLAVDLRISNIRDKTTLDSIVFELKKRLGLQYDVVLEKDHIHIEFQPK